MELSPEICERARQSRDARFDGHFFIAVKTTGVFCRPTCPVQPPKAKNVRFYPTAAAALGAGFRPCLRCLPELAPGSRRFNNGLERIDQALKLIDGGFLDDHDSTQLAARIGVTQRHLSRQFEQYIGATPHRVAHTRRLLFAKHLLDESNLPVTDIAFAAGFHSLRRFNSAVKDTWNRTPSELRKQKSRGETGDAIRLTLGYRPPFDWGALLDFYRQRAIPAVESITETTYSRTIRIGGRTGWFSVRPAPAGHRLELVATLPDVRLLSQLATRVRRMFDLDADPMVVAAALRRDELLRPVLAANPGLRLPGAWDPFEISVRAVIGQQISVAAARTIAGRIVSEFGEPVEQAQTLESPPFSAPAGSRTRSSQSESAAWPSVSAERSGPGIPAPVQKPGPDRLFPRPEALADAALETLGIIGSRARTIRRLAGEVASGAIDFSAAGMADKLTTLPGIGDWTAQYVALRSGVDPDAFPASDLGLLRGAEDGEKMTPARLRKRAEAWRPWRGYAALCLWRRYADKQTREAVSRPRGPEASRSRETAATEKRT